MRSAVRRVPVPDLLCVAAIALLYVYLATHFRVSVLRQDWWWSLRRSDFVSYALDATTGWSPAGIGTPVTYPTGYIAALFLLCAAVVMSPPVAQGVYIGSVSLACSIGALHFAGRAAAPPIRLGVVLFATFNPWVYTETVAGHFYMIVAYAATMYLFGESSRRAAGSLRFCTCFLFIIQQLQFVFVPLAIFVARAVSGRARLPLAFAVVLLLPAGLGIVLEHDTLTGTPYLLEWEKGASVAPADAIRLLGYFAGYGASVSAAMGYAMDATVLLALFGFAALRYERDRSLIVMPAIAFFATLYATGSRGPIAPVFEAIVLGVPESGIFRELYDLLAYTAMALLILGSIAARRNVVARYTFLGVGCMLAACWFYDEPAGYTVAARRLPSIAIDGPARTRYALFPAFQPLALGHTGSGLDPDAFALGGDRTPINQFMPSYPVDTALALYAATCDAARLSRLGVASIYRRPWLVAPGSQNRPDGTQCGRGRFAANGPLPLVSLSSPPAAGTLNRDVGSGNVFFGDLPEYAASVYPIRAERRFADPAEGWVDARLSFAREPALGQAFGGAMTTSPSATLDVRPGVPLLVFVRGRLESAAGAVLSSESGASYRWISLPPSIARVRCRGECVVALQGRPPATLPLDPPLLPARALLYRMWAPFMLTVRVPAGPPALLRYDVTFGKYWLAFAGPATLEHVRIDAATNGWQLGARAAETSVCIVEIAAALECAAIVLAVTCSLALIWKLVGTSRSL